MTLKIGDVVQLKSGGPLMTVTGVGKAQANCVWFTRSGGLGTGHIDGGYSSDLHVTSFANADQVLRVVAQKTKGGAK